MWIWNLINMSRYHHLIMTLCHQVRKVIMLLIGYPKRISPTLPAQSLSGEETRPELGFNPLGSRGQRNKTNFNNLERSATLLI